MFASLKPGGRLAIIDSAAEKGSPLPDGVPANRGGHGVSSAVVIQEILAAGFSHVETVDSWQPPSFLILFQK